MPFSAIFSKDLIILWFVFSGRPSKRIVGAMQGGDSDEDVSPSPSQHSCAPGLGLCS
jgi:hypothetical protein